MDDHSAIKCENGQPPRCGRYQLRGILITASRETGRRYRIAAISNMQSLCEEKKGAHQDEQVKILSG
ncbi:hypothetical protein DB032_22390 [Chromobacterium sp. Panama]|nr:hypothetical protein DB032_22390 [Chromobacterium sp. Panama]